MPLMDPIGLALENFDAVGLYRTHENGVPIDASGAVPGAPAWSTARWSWCSKLATRWRRPRPALPATGWRWRYGRTLAAAEDDVPAGYGADQAFAASGYNVRQLLLALTQTDASCTAAASDAHGKFRLAPQDVLRGAGSIAIALPWLEIMGPAARARRRRARAALCGRVQARRHRARPLHPHRHRDRLHARPDPRSRSSRCRDTLLVIDGLDMKSAMGEQHQAGIVALLTGTPQRDGGSGYAGGPVDRSGDRHAHLRAASKPPGQHPAGRALGHRQVEGAPAPINALNYEDNASFNPIPPRLAPAQIFDDLFGSRGARRRPARPTPASRARSPSSTTWAGATQTLAARLGAADRQKLEQHLTKLREIEQAASTAPPASPAVRLHGARPGRHLGLQPAHRPERRRRPARSWTAGPTPPSPRSAST